MLIRITAKRLNHDKHGRLQRGDVVDVPDFQGQEFVLSGWAVEHEPEPAPAPAPAPVTEPEPEPEPEPTPREQAEALGIKIDGRWSDARILAEIKRAKAA
ncbi:MAG: hypothetical protein RLZZ524_2046 [Pseudomonadota bacterium]|jgi:hypothetical protein